MSKPTPGGARPGAGRPTTVGASERITITITPADLAYLQSLAPKVSEAVRLLIAAHRTALVHRYPIAIGP